MRIDYQQCFGRSNDEIANDLIKTGNDLIILGYTASNDGDVTGHHGYDDNSNVWLVRIDTVGNIIWEHCYGGSGIDAAHNVFKTGDGGFIVFGDTESTDGDVIGNHGGKYYPDIWIFKVTDTSTVVSLSDVKAVSQYKVYPNPARNYVILELPVKPATETVFYVSILKLLH